MSIALFHLNRQLAARALSRVGPLAITQCKATSSTLTPEIARYREKSSAWVEKNENQLKRPMSPHIQIYRFPFQVFSSGFHRFTGVILNIMLYTAGPLAILATGHSAEILNYIYHMDLPSWSILSVKLLLAWPLSYHTLNGIRHLAWDTGKGFHQYEKITLAVVGLSFAMAFGIASL